MLLMKQTLNNVCIKPADLKKVAVNSKSYDIATLSCLDCKSVIGILQHMSKINGFVSLRIHRTGRRKVLKESC